jgi:hypothetical protein
MAQKDFNVEIEEKKELYGYQKGDIDKIFDRLDNAPNDHHFLRNCSPLFIPTQ